MSMSIELSMVSSPSSQGSTEPASQEELLSELWIGVVLAAMVLSCIGCLCTCFLYHTFQKWHSRIQGGVETGYDTASLPSYTTVGGLPTYEEAMEQQMLSSSSLPIGNPPPFSKLSVGEFLEIYREDVKK